MTYAEKSTQVVLESQIAVMVMLNPDNTDIEMWPLKPLQAATTPQEEFVTRKLRAVGVAGLCGTKAVCAFKEPLDSNVVGAIGTSFAEYIGVLLGDSVAGQFEERQKGDEVDWLKGLWGLPDTRLN